jgi:putative ABC transport system ATP-binding protein
MIQRRQFVRVVGDLSHRFPRVDWRAVEGKFPRELANRIFDIVTIQKATSVLLFDGVALTLTTLFGMLLLAFYHPYLLGFVIVLLIVMISLTWLLGRGGVRTAIAESAAKYEVAHWLQDVIAFPSAFRVNGGEALAIEKANQLTVNYLKARRNQFRVLLRQVAFAIGLQVIASTVILGLGGWLVISRELTLGQLVASELVVTIVVGAFAKAGKSIEKFYDLMAGLDKVGYLLDLPILERMNESRGNGSSEVAWEELTLSNGLTVPAGQVGSGGCVAVVSRDANHVSEFLRCCAGLVSPKRGTLEVDHEEPCQSMSIDPGWIGYAGGDDVFRGTLIENLQLGRMGVTGENVREVLRAVRLWDEIGDLPDDLQTLLQTGGYPLTRKQVGKLMLARAVVGHPGLLLLDRVLDELPLQETKEILQSIRQHVRSTILIGTQSEDLASLLDQKITLETSFSS